MDSYTILARTRVVDANNRVTGHMSNSLGQLVLVREYSGAYPNPSASADTRYTYDAAGNLTAVRQSNWNNSQPTSFLSETGMTYDGYGRKISMNDPDMGNWTYAYNAAGSLTEQRDANLARLCFYYDEFDRLTNKRHDNNNDGCGTGDTRLAYYAYYGSGAGKVGKPSEIRWGSSDTQNRETFDYDSLGRLITHNRWVDSRQYTMSYSGFDALHRPGTRVLTWPNGNTHTTTVTYDHEGENTLVGGGTTLVTTVGYNDMGQLKRLALNNGLTTWYGYSGYETSGNNDAFDMKEITWNWGTNRSYGRLWRICTAPHANTRCQAAEKDLSVNGQVLDMRHSYDNVGNVAAVRDYVNANQLQTFGYDHLNRLTSAGTNSAGSGQYTHTYAYNTLGNLTSYNGATYTYGSSLHKHAVTAANGVSYSYDANGNMTLRDAAGTVNDYTQNFNVENELASVVNNGNTTTFAYDAAGIRVKTVRPGGKTSYFPFPGLEEEVNGSTTTRRITYSVAGQAIALRVQVVGGNNTLYYLHTDHLGSTSLATNTSGAVISGSTSRYYPFGNWRTEPTAGLTDRGFTGHLHNNIGNAPDDIGLVYMQARWYLPYINRFVSADTIVPDPANPQSFNRYSYAYNNPLRFRDADGHRPCEWVCPGDWIPVGSFTGAGYNGSWDIQQQQENSARAQALMVDVIGTAVGILWEPADWAIALSDGVQWYDGLGMLPLVPASFGDNIGRAAARFIPAGVGDEAGQAIGHWVSRNLGNQPWARYQARITGVEGAEFMFNGVRFDGAIGTMNTAGGITDLVLLDAKDWSVGFMHQLQNNQTLYNSKLDDAWRQINAAGGTKIQWHFSVKEVADWWRQQLEIENIVGIEVVYTP